MGIAQRDYMQAPTPGRGVAALHLLRGRAGMPAQFSDQLSAQDHPLLPQLRPSRWRTGILQLLVHRQVLVSVVLLSL